MELQTIVERYAEAMAHVDATTNVVASKRNQGKDFYQPGIEPMTETVVVGLVDQAWESLRPGERTFTDTEIGYPQLPSSKIDHLLTTDGQVDEVEWGMEVKRLQFVGDNGSNGDYEVAKMLSPYLKDRGVLHDALRLRTYGFTRRIAVVGYGFEYDESSLDEAERLHTSPRAAQTVENIVRLVGRNGPLYYRPLIEFADAILRLRGWTIGPRAEARFEAWRHPSGGMGIVFGWEIRRPELERDYDPRHPW